MQGRLLWFSFAIYFVQCVNNIPCWIRKRLDLDRGQPINQLRVNVGSSSFFVSSFCEGSTRAPIGRHFFITRRRQRGMLMTWEKLQFQDFPLCSFVSSFGMPI